METIEFINKKMAYPFTMLSNALASDNKLSITAKGLYFYLSTKPVGWVFHLATILKENKGLTKYSYKKIMKELVDTGYLSRQNARKKGRFCGVAINFNDPELVAKKHKDRSHRGSNYERRSDDPLNNTNIKNNTKEKIKNKKEKSQSDNSKDPFGVAYLEVNMNLDDIVNAAKTKSKEAKERKEKKKEQNPVFTKKKTNAVELTNYFYSIIPPDTVERARRFQETDSIYKFISDCKNVGITELKDQKLVLKFFVDFWKEYRKILSETHYCSMEIYPNLYNIVFCFYRVGLFSNGFGLHIDRNLFKKGDN